MVVDTPVQSLLNKQFLFKMNLVIDYRLTAQKSTRFNSFSFQFGLNYISLDQLNHSGLDKTDIGLLICRERLV